MKPVLSLKLIALLFMLNFTSNALGKEMLCGNKPHTNSDGSITVIYTCTVDGSGDSDGGGGSNPPMPSTPPPVDTESGGGGSYDSGGGSSGGTGSEDSTGNEDSSGSEESTELPDTSRYYTEETECKMDIEEAHQSCLSTTRIGGLVTGGLCGFLVVPQFIASCLSLVGAKVEYDSLQCNIDKPKGLYWCSKLTYP